MGADQSQPYWDKDADHPTCRKCKKAFSLTNRRSHCRCCCRIFCHDCSTARGIPSGMPYKEPVRLCDDCGRNAKQKRVCGCRPDLDSIRGAPGGGRAGAGENGNGPNSQSARQSAANNASNRESAANAAGGQHLNGAASGLNGNGGGDGSGNNLLHGNGAAAGDNNGKGADAREQQEHEATWKQRINAITRALNDEIVDLGPFSSDYGLHFSDSPVYGMRIATVVGPVAFGLPTPDPTNSESVAQLLCGDVVKVPSPLVAVHSQPVVKVC